MVNQFLTNKPSIGSFSQHKLPYAINYLCAMPGCGKTEASKNDAAQKTREGKNVIYVTTSLEQSRELEQRIRSTHKDIYPKRIDSDNYNGIVSKSIAKFIEKPPPDGCLLIVTNEGYARLPYFYKKEEWVSYFDETVQPIQDISLNISDSVLKGHFPLFDYFDFERTTNPDLNGLLLAKVKKNKKADVERMARNKRNDEIWNVISNFCSKILDPMYSVYVDEKCINDLYFGWTSKSYTKLHAYAVLEDRYLDGFEECKVLSAFFEFTTFHHYFKERFNFVLNERLQGQLRSPFQLEKDITLIIMIRNSHDTDWSKNFYSKMVDGQSIINQCMDGAREQFRNRKFCYLSNKGLAPIEEGEALPYASRGLNKWDHYNNFAFLGAYNGDIQFLDFCARFGLAEVVSHDNNILVALQAIHRISLRDPDSTDPIEIALPTEKMALQIKYFLPNAKIVISDDAIDVPNELIKKRGQRGKGSNSLNQALRSRINYNKKTNIISMNKGIFVDDVGNSQDSFLFEKNYNKGSFQTDSQNINQDQTSQEDECPLSAIPDMSEDTEVIELSIFADKYRNGYNTLDPDNLKDIEDFLEWCSKRELSSKEENFLMCLAVFDKNKLVEYKEKLEEWENNGRIGEKPAMFCKQHIKKMAPLLFLDFDGGNLLPEDLKKIFPDMWIITHSTYSHTNELPKFRAILALSRSCSVEEYEIIAAKTVLMIEDYCENSGIDLGKLAAGSLFYAPGIGRDREAAFFECIHGDRIDVEMMLKSKLGVEQIETPIYKETVVNQEVTEEDQQEVIQEYLERRHVQQLLDALQHKQGGQAGTFNTTICRIAGKISNAPLFVKEYFRIELINRGANANEVMDIWRRYAKYPG